MGVVSGCGEQEVGVASGSGWNLWVWLLGVVRNTLQTLEYLVLGTLSRILNTTIVFYG